MNKSIVQSERQRPRAVEIMKDIYASHIADPNCPYGGEKCPMMQDLKKQIETEEALLPGHVFSRSFELK